MRVRAPVAVVVAVLVSVGCGKKSADRSRDEPEGGDDLAEPAPVAAPGAARPPPAGADPTPPRDEGEGAEADAALGPTSPATAAGTVLFSAVDETSVAVTWSVPGAEILFRALLVGRRGAGIDVQVLMSSSGASQLVTVCRGLSTEEIGSATVYARSDTVAVVACSTRRDAVDDGRSWGVRLAFNPDKGIVEPSGGFSVPGIELAFEPDGSVSDPGTTADPDPE